MNASEKNPGLYTRKDRTPFLSADEKEALEQYCTRYLNYLGKAKTERRAYEEAVRLLEAQGFRDLSQCPSLKPGDKVYRGYFGKTLFAAIIGANGSRPGLRIVGGHTDAPRIDLKPVPVVEMGGLAYFDAHYYGGIKKFHWVAHPLALYGVVIKPDGTKIEIEIGDRPNDPVFMISDILPHFGREQAKKTLDEAIPGESLDLLIGSTPAPHSEPAEKDPVKAHILALLSERYEITECDLTSAELEIVPAGMPREMGLDRSMLLGYGHDDRICAYAGLEALLSLGDSIPEKTCAVLLCDKEEIGSVGATGMDSTFFENSVAELLEREIPGTPDIYLRRALEASCMLSADVCAASDPHFPNADSPNNAAHFNAGPCVIKYTGAGGKGSASDARAEFLAELRRIFDEANVTWQIGELGRVENGGGGTIAKFLARYGMDVCDIGTPLLNMHAPWEGASKFDTYMTFRAYAAFFGNIPEAPL